MRTRALHTEAWFCAKAIVLYAACIGCPIAKPSHADWGFRGFRDRRQFDEKLKALLFAELLNSASLYDFVPSRQFASRFAQVQWERNEIGAVTDGALQTANAGCAGIQIEFPKIPAKTWRSTNRAREDDSIRDSYARRDSVAVNVLSTGQCGGWLRSGWAKTWPENKPNRSNASVDRCQTQSFGIYRGRELTWYPVQDISSRYRVYPRSLTRYFICNDGISISF